jgi:hypothetical protein
MKMAKMLKERREMRETETLWDGTVNETRFFKISARRFNWLLEYGTLAAVQPFDYVDHIISVSAYIDSDTEKWNGWNWLSDEFASAGLGW